MSLILLILALVLGSTPSSTAAEAAVDVVVHVTNYTIFWNMDWFSDPDPFVRVGCAGKYDIAYEFQPTPTDDDVPIKGNGNPGRRNPGKIICSHLIFKNKVPIRGRVYLTLEVEDDDSPFGSQMMSGRQEFTPANGDTIKFTNAGASVTVTVEFKDSCHGGDGIGSDGKRNCSAPDANGHYFPDLDINVNESNLPTIVCVTEMIPSDMEFMNPNPVPDLNDMYIDGYRFTVAQWIFTGAEIYDRQIQYELGEPNYPRVYNINGYLTTNFGKTVTRGDYQIIPPELANDPTPADGQINVPLDMVIIWLPGQYSNKHDVYFGTNSNNVRDANRTNPLDVLVSQNQDANTYDPCGLLDMGQNYYWRVDEINDACAPYIWKSDVWSFTTILYRTVDDFEDYASSSALKAVWKDYWTNNTRAFTSLETATVHDGNKAMRYEYLNSTSPRYAEATATMTDLGAPTNWTDGGLKTLNLYFHGNATNQKTQMYVALTDSANRTGLVALDDPNDITRGWKDYQEWNIELQRFNDVNNVNLSSISRITLGFGNKFSPQSATGTVYFDDIRLYPSRCVLEKAAAGGDYDYWDGDCTVNYIDVNKLSDNWLLSAIGNVSTSAPPDANKLRHYTLDDNVISGPSKSKVTDSSTYAQHGTLYGDVDGKGAPIIVATGEHSVPGKINRALYFDGVDDFVNLPPLDVNTNTITFSAWVSRNVVDTNMYQGILFAAGPNVVAGIGLGADREIQTQNYELWYMWDSNDWLFDTELIMPGDGLWSFMAMTVTPNVTTLYLYDGVELRAARNFITNPKKNFTDIPMRIADQLHVSNRKWKGKIDDVRIYNYTLTPGQILYLAKLGVAGSQYIKLEPWRPNGNADGVIDMRDFAILADNWLEQVYWP